MTLPTHADQSHLVKRLRMRNVASAICHVNWLVVLLERKNVYVQKISRSISRDSRWLMVSWKILHVVRNRQMNDHGKQANGEQCDRVLNDINCVKIYNYSSFCVNDHEDSLQLVSRTSGIKYFFFERHAGLKKSASIFDLESSTRKFVYRIPAKRARNPDSAISRSKHNIRPE